MKALSISLIIVATAIAFTSCQKEYTCICYNTLNNTAELMPMTARNENNARNQCVAKMDNQNNVSGNSCDLKK